MSWISWLPYSEASTWMVVKSDQLAPFHSWTWISVPQRSSGFFGNLHSMIENVSEVILPPSSGIVTTSPLRSIKAEATPPSLF